MSQFDRLNQILQLSTNVDRDGWPMKDERHSLARRLMTPLLLESRCFSNPAASRIRVPMPTIRDIMIHSPQTIYLDETISDAVERMLAGCTSRIYVLDRERRLCGVVTDYALLKHQMQGLDTGSAVESIVARAVPAVAIDAPFLSAIALLRESCCSRIAVTQGEHLRGEITRIRVLRTLCQPRVSEARSEVDTRPAIPQDSIIPEPKFLKPRGLLASRSL